jgi:hypothetical protein
MSAGYPAADVDTDAVAPLLRRIRPSHALLRGNAVHLVEVFWSLVPTPVAGCGAGVLIGHPWRRFRSAGWANLTAAADHYRSQPSTRSTHFISQPENASALSREAVGCCTVKSLPQVGSSQVSLP